MQIENIPGLFSNDIYLSVKLFFIALCGNGGKRKEENTSSENDGAFFLAYARDYN